MFGFFVASSLIAPSLNAHQQKQKSKEPERHITLSIEHQKNLRQRLDDFTQKHLAALSPEELQYLANLIYFSYALSSLDSHVRTQAQEILLCAKATQTALLSYTQTTEPKEYLSKILNTIGGALQAQNEYLASWQQCSAAEDSLPTDSPLLKAIEVFKEAITLEIGAWAHDHQDEFDAQLDQCSKAITETSESLSMVGATYKNLRNNTSTLPSIPENKSVAKIALVSRANENVDEHCWKALNATLQLAEIENVLQELSIAIAGLYYQATYTQLNACDARYRTFMYNAQGLIPAEQRTLELPNLP